MSVGYGVSYQYAGLNRTGEYLKTRRYGKTDGREQKAEGGKRNEIWRRITGITLACEDGLKPKARRAGIGRLVKWIERKVSRKDAKALRTERTEISRKDAKALRTERTEISRKDAKALRR